MAANSAIIPYTLLTKHAPSFTTDPLSVNDDDNWVAVLIDRTIVSGINYAPDSVLLSEEELQSNDGGSTWQALGGATGIPAGFRVNGGIHNTMSRQLTAGSSLAPGTGRLVSVTITASGLTGSASIAIVGAIFADPSNIAISGLWL